MRHAVYVKRARKAIYTQGKTVTKVRQSGKHKGSKYTMVDRTQPASKSDTVFIAKGEAYWWWAFRFGPKRYIKTQPKRSMLTQSEWLSHIYALEEGLEDASIDSIDDRVSCVTLPSRRSAA